MSDPATRGINGTEAKITLSLSCNNDCLFCYNRKEKILSSTLEEQRIIDLIDQAA